MKVYIENNILFSEEIKYIWELFSRNKTIEFQYVENKIQADFIIDTSNESNLPISLNFYQGIKEKRYHHSYYFKNDCIIRANDENPDYFATSFYMINSIQEYDDKDRDEIGRFKFNNSYQKKFECVGENLVQKYFDAVVNNIPVLHPYRNNKKKSRIFLSHDIDSINGALLQDGVHLLKQGKPNLIFNLLMNAVLSKPDWLNMDKIMKIEDEYSFKSTFYWLINKGRINQRQTNSDYNIQNKKIKNILNQISLSNKWENGLHKSIAKDTIDEEIAKSGFNPIGNRFHYLKFSLPDAYDEIESSKLKLDASLGFAEMYGFRNNYGQPFKPYNIKKSKNYSFVEVPLNVMDGTFQRYIKTPTENTAKTIIDFIEKNKYNCLLSILWHNTFFTDYKYGGYLKEYKKILCYLYENKFDCLNQSQILEEYA